MFAKFCDDAEWGNLLCFPVFWTAAPINCIDILLLVCPKGSLSILLKEKLTSMGFHCLAINFAAGIWISVWIIYTPGGIPLDFTRDKLTPKGFSFSGF